MDCNYLGAHAESQFISYALEQGWEVAHPFLKSAPYDSLIRRDPNEPWETVQIKRAYHNQTRDNISVEFRRGNWRAGTRGAYKDGDFDWLFVFHEKGKWFLPWDLVKRKRSTIVIGSKTYDLWRV